MKKYNLHLKEDRRGLLIPFSNLMKWGNDGKPGREYLSKTDKGFILVEDCDERVSELTQQELDKLPHGFVKLFDLIEVKEELYYIKMPYAKLKVLNEDSRYGEVRFTDRIETAYFKTKFTLEYIEETYPELKQFAVKVKEIDNV